MLNMGLNQIREEYLKYFESKDHLRMKSFSLIPDNDKSLLLVNAGMAPLKPYFTGMQIPPSKRIATCQKCIRTGDIENVGKTSRHATYFEMLGNFSFGDYFKKEIIPWAWEFVTEVMEIPKDRLYATVYFEDDEAFDIWAQSTDIEHDRIFRLGKKDNFWEHGLGPCGPCSEIHFDRGEGKITTVDEFTKAQDDDRVVEFWNLVFTQFDKDESGVYNRLANPNIDTGMGLERMATIMQGVGTIFEVDTIKSILDKVCEITGKKYGTNAEQDISLRIITDHVRSVTFMICDGVLPSNEGRGYVLRRLLRRASRHGRLFGVNNPFLYNICDVVVENSYVNYPELKEKLDYIKKVIKLEEERFSETIDGGMDILKQYIAEMEKEKSYILSGEKAFKLYDTYGFPLELTAEILEEKGLELDAAAFNIEMEDQRQRARAARETTNYMGMEDSLVNKIPIEIKSEFVGYDNTETTSRVEVLIKDEEFVSAVQEGSTAVLVASKTPFYAEMGGQVGDYGVISNGSFKAKVVDCKKNIAGKTLHFIEVTEGTVNVGDEILLSVDKARRNSICKNHTATHLLQAALRKVLGDHVHQSGSYVDNERLRFDFTHFTSMTSEEVKRVEKIVNEAVMGVVPVTTVSMTLEEAKKTDAMAVFDDKYTDEVRVVAAGDFSKELCGGTHVNNSGQIGMFKIISENGVAAGVRRIEAVTGFGALSYIYYKDTILEKIETYLKTSEKDIINKIHSQIVELKEKEKEISSLKAKIASGAEDEIINNVKIINGVKLAKAVLKDIDANSLRDLADKIRDKIVNGIVVLGSNYEGKVQLVAMASKNAVEQGVHCGKIIKEVAGITGGSGGGRPDMAQAGGKLPEKLEEAMVAVDGILEKLLNK